MNIKTFKMDKINSIIIALLFVVLFFVCIAVCKKCEKEKTETIIREKHDTLYVYLRDTIFKEKVYYTPQRIDTFIVFKNNTDTLFIQGIAKDTINIDSLNLDLHGQTTIIRDSVFITKNTFVDEKFSWNIGVNAMIIAREENILDFGIETGLNFKDGSSVELGYYFINKQLNLGYKKKILRIKK